MAEETTVPDTAEQTDIGDAQQASWVVVASGVTEIQETPVRRRRVFLQVILGAVVVIIAVAFAGVIAARRLAEAEAVADAAKTSDLLAELLVQPAIEDGILTGDPQALAAVDEVVHDHVLANQPVVRVKLWDPTGRIVYSDETRLIGMTFALGEEELGVFTNPEIRAEVSDLAAPENLYERDSGQLLETYRPVWTPSGQPLLFEAYFRYDEVTARSGQLWRGFAGITLSSLLILVVLLLPILWRLLDRLKHSQEQRESLLQRAIDASTEERRRIAGTLHDGVVQDLAATSFAVAGAAEQAATAGDQPLAGDLRRTAATVRTTIGSLRSLLVDIYPASLTDGGLVAALADLAGGLRSRDIEVVLELGPIELDGARQRLIYRVAKECLTNVRRHSAATSVTVRLYRDGPDAVLEIGDNGTGFDINDVLSAPEDGHFGVRVLGDVAAEAGAELRVRTAPSQGALWQLRVPS